MQNFLRQCNVIIGNSTKSIQIDDLRITFEIKKQRTSYPGLAQINIYNLSQETRNLIKNQFTNILVNAGYGENGFHLPLIFTGNIKNVYHRIDGVDTTTMIYAADGDAAWQDNTVNITFGGAVTLRDMVITLGTGLNGVLFGDLNGLDQPKISNAPVSFNCSVREALDQLSKTYNFDWSIQNGLLETVAHTGGMTSQNQAIVVSAATGMVGSPTVTEIGANVTTFLNPAFLPNRWILIQSAGSAVNLGNPYFHPQTKPPIANGYFLINSVAHTFDNRGDDALTTLETRAPGTL